MSQIVCLHSFRGGTGKSNLTANLATAIACLGQQVGIIDSDIQSPGIHFLFRLDEKKIERTLNDYLWGRCTIKDTAYDVSSPQVTEANGRIFLIPSSLKGSEISRILREGYDVALLKHGFEELIDRLKLDYLFIDTHPGLNEETLLSITLSHVLVIILRPDHQDFQGTAVTVELAEKLKIPKMLLVVNKVPSSLDFDAVRQQMKELYNVPVAGLLPVCDEMIQLASRDIFYLRYPEHPCTQELRAIINKIRA